MFQILGNLSTAQFAVESFILLGGEISFAQKFAVLLLSQRRGAVLSFQLANRALNLFDLGLVLSDFNIFGCTGRFQTLYIPLDIQYLQASLAVPPQVARRSSCFLPGPPLLP